MTNACFVFQRKWESRRPCFNSRQYPYHMIDMILGDSDVFSMWWQCRVKSCAGNHYRQNYWNGFISSWKSTETCLVEDFLKRGALPLLFFAKKAKSEIQNAKVSKTKATNGENSEPKKLATGENSAAAVSALLCIRLLAQQLQSMVQSTLVQQSNEFRVEGEAVCCRSMGLSPSVSPNKASLTTPPPSMTPETEDLALALAHWVSTEWCSPRIEVVVAWLCLTDSVRFVCPRFVRQFHWHTQHLKALKRGKFRRNGRHNSTRIWKFEEKLTYLTWFVYVCSLTARKNVRTTYPAALIRSFCPKIVTIWS